jgi:hypothetical protein
VRANQKTQQRGVGGSIVIRSLDHELHLVAGALETS